MKRTQALNFWKAWKDSTSVEGAISSFEFKEGYGGRRTLERYAQAARGFGQGDSPEEVAKKTGWSMAYVAKIRGWWEGACSGAMPTQRPGNEITMSSQPVSSDGQNQPSRFEKLPVSQREELRRFLKEWRSEIERLWLEFGWKSYLEDLAKRAFSNPSEFDTSAQRYQESRVHHAKAILFEKARLNVESDVLFTYMKDRLYPDDEVWTAQEVWGTAFAAYLKARDAWMREIQRFAQESAELLWVAILKTNDDEASSTSDLDSVRTNKQKYPELDRFLELVSVALACDTLERGIAEQPEEAFWYCQLDILKEVRNSFAKLGMKTQFYNYWRTKDTEIERFAQALWNSDNDTCKAIKEKTSELLKALLELHAAEFNLSKKLDALEIRLLAE